MSQTGWKDLSSRLSTARWKKIVSLSLPYQDSRDDEGHAAAVTAWADYLCHYYEVRKKEELILCAALLHDIGWSRLSDLERMDLFSHRSSAEELQNLRIKHEQEGSELARELMEEASYEESFIQEVCTLIKGHDTRESFLNPEDGILKDADKLWMLTNEGFAADLRRRNLSAESWAETLDSMFNKKDFFYSDHARTQALRRLSRLRRKAQVPSPGVEFRPTVLISHYRVGWTDGVSLEIEKRQSILEENGFNTLLLAGPRSQGADYIIPDLDFDSEEARKISRNAFHEINTEEFSSIKDLMAAIEILAEKIEKEIDTVFEDCKPDFILLHNIFSHGRHIAAAQAFHNSIKKYHIPSLATHHDFHWERDDFRTASDPAIEDFLMQYVPPRIPEMKHATINTLASESLKKRSGIESMVFPDTLDFSIPHWEKDEYNSSFLNDFDLRENDILILQATRIVRRKGIELIPPLMEKLNSPSFLEQLKGKTFYNGKKWSPQSRFVYVLAGYAEQEAESYRLDVQKMMDEKKVPYRFIHQHIAVERKQEGDRKTYSLFDCYPYADLVAYPSLFEGWGNQFIEAVFAHKPVIVHEYPVYKSDIKEEGYSVISLGDGAYKTESNLYKLSDATLEKAAQEIIDWLLSDETENKLSKNYHIAQSNNSYDALRQLMKEGMQHYEDI